MGDIEDFIKEELRRDLNKTLLQDLYGPAIYGPGNFEVVLDEAGEWELKPNAAWQPATPRGLFNG